MRFLNIFRKFIDSIAVIFMTAMFISFILQIFSRYVLNEPLSWTLEACLITWLWTVLWTGGFILKDHDHVKFDILYVSSSPRLKKLFASTTCIFIIISFIFSFPATVDYVTFMSIESSSSLKIRLDIIFSFYLLFMFGVIVYYTIRLLKILRGDISKNS